MRRDIVHPGADSLTYEIRSIVAVGHKMAGLGVEITWENIGDPVEKGEGIAPWIKTIVHDTLDSCKTWGYCDSQGEIKAREVLSKLVNERGGVQITSDDILFFNGLGDAIGKIFSGMRREARIIGPTPAYSTHSSGEASHSGYEHLTYHCDPKNNWLPDIDELERNIRYNDTITGILLISPNNPTGAVYPRSVLDAIVDIARKYDLMIINDEIYCHVVYNGAQTVHLSQVLGDVPGIALRGISKELPWPGSRCGWIEIFNRDKDTIFNRYVQSLIDAKMLEVCSTSLPQAVIPKIYNDPRLIEHLKTRAKVYETRAQEAFDILNSIEGVSVVLPQGAFYMTIVFDEGVLSENLQLKPFNDEVGEYLEQLLKNDLNPDHRFTYQLMAHCGVCVVPLSSFCCELQGFRMTLLEEDDQKRRKTLQMIKDGIEAYLKS